MKQFSIIFFFLLFATIGFSQIDTEIKSAISSGSATSLSRHFHSSIDLTVAGSEGMYSKAQAEQIVSDFFSSNRPSALTDNHWGTSGSNSRYFIGTLATSGGSYRVYVLLTTIDGRELIETLRFETQP